MKIKKLEHSGIWCEKNNNILLCDPVEIEGKITGVKNVVVIILTHLHADHFQKDLVEKLVAENAGIKVFVPDDMAEILPAAEVVHGGDQREVGGFRLEFFSDEHAPVFDGKSPCKNVGVMVDGVWANPGDSFAVPPKRPCVLLVPIVAPWNKMEEVTDYIAAVQPEIMIPVHDGLLSDFGKNVFYQNIKLRCSDVKFMLGAEV